MKVFLKLLIVVILCTVIDLFCIYGINKPLFAVKSNIPYKYTGILYDTYNCPEYSSPQIKLKGIKYACAVGNKNLDKVANIVDMTKEIKNFSCAEALEFFYEDNEYKYYYSCIKGEYIRVKYENGYEETVEQALKYGRIKITDLDRYDIDYIKYEK